jgi:O-antigen ligase/polysaccharide polymerase Wzy-like membrane protein
MRADIAARDHYVPPLALAIGAVFFAGVMMLAFDSPVPVLGALVVMCGVMALMLSPSVALVALLFLEPFHTAIVISLLEKGQVGVGSLFYWKDGLILALFVRAVMVRFSTDRTLSRERDGGDAFLLLYVALYLMLAVTSPPRSTVTPALLAYIEGPLLLIAIVQLRPTRRQLEWCIGAILAAAGIMGAAAIYEHFGPQLEFQKWWGAPGREFFVGDTGTYRSASFLNDTLILGFYLGGAVPLALAAFVMRSRWRVAAFACLAACAGGLFFTITRSGYIGGATGALIVLMLAVRNPRIRWPLVGALAVVGLSATLYYTSSSSDVLVRSSSNKAHRAALERGFNLLYAKPFGHGLGTTDRYSYRPGVGRGTLGATESSYLAKGLEGGVPALLMYVSALFVTGMRLRTKRRRLLRAGDDRGVILASGAIGTMLAIAFAGLFLGIQELVVEVMLWAPAGIALAWPEPEPA